MSQAAAVLPLLSGPESEPELNGVLPPALATVLARMGRMRLRMSSQLSYVLPAAGLFPAAVELLRNGTEGQQSAAANEMRLTSACCQACYGGLLCAMCVGCKRVAKIWRYGS